jgi:dynein heavy chain, axonemal
VEFWLAEVETRMRASVRKQCIDAIAAYTTKPRTQWVLQWPAMVVLAISGVFWARSVEAGVKAGNMPGVLEQNTTDLMGLTELVRGKLSKMERMTLGALITIDVHARDVVAELVECSLSDVSDFEWVKQLRYYWRDDLFVDMVQVRLCTQPYVHRRCHSTWL